MPGSTLERIAGGDRAAVAECIDRHGGLVWSIARRLCIDRSEAEDAVQEIFIDLWSSAGRFDPSRSSEAAFVAMIARRRLIDRRRKGRRRPGAMPLPDALACPGEGPERRVDDVDEAGRASIALASLGDDQRRVLLRAIYDGKTYAEIAEETGLPLGTVKTHARRGLIRLREALVDHRPAPSPSTPGGDR